VPKAEYFTYSEIREISTVLESFEDQLNDALVCVRNGDRNGLYHALNNLCGSFKESTEEFGYFHQILEEYF